MKKIILFLLVIMNVKAFGSCYKIETNFINLVINDSKKLITLNKLIIHSVALNSTINFTMKRVNKLTMKKIEKTKSALSYRADNYFEGAGFSVNIVLKNKQNFASMIINIEEEDSGIEKYYDILNIKSINCESK